MGRLGLSASQKRELWERWKRGQSLNDIARALAKHRGSIHSVLSSHGATGKRNKRVLCPRTSDYDNSPGDLGLGGP